eukprot:403374747
MKSLPQKVDYFLWNQQEEFFNNVGYSAPFISFVNMQIVRLISLILILVIWMMNFYINVKKCVMYLNFWSLSFTLLGLGFLFVSSGRQVIERKLAEKNQPVEEKEKSTTWKTGILLYTLAWPFTIASNVTFFLFFREDQACQTYIDFGFEQWRGYVMLFAVIMPLIALIVDFLLNRLVMSHKHVMINLLVCVLYIFLSFLGSVAQQRPIYGHHLGYFAHSDFKYEYVVVSQGWASDRLAECRDHFKDWTQLQNDIPVDWAKTWISLATIIASIVVSHIILTFLHNLKSKKYFLRDGRVNEKKAKLLDNQDKHTQ